ncbi:sensor histidine kinase [Paenibacillus chartarius]|uniref:histidine kinase n=1 Tax=Paenibacillus chartarius TaxID=747481 RepID=A0ABV6DPM9_9BACL
MGTMRIRTLTILGFLLILTLPWISFVTANAIVTKSWRLGEHESRQTADERMGGELAYVPQTAAAAAGLLLAFVIAGTAMRRLVLQPLESMSLAARQLAKGDWDVQLPRRGVAEIADVQVGFDVMVQGLRQSFMKQAELEEQRRFVMAALAHDLRTPLFALRGYLDGLEQGIVQSPEQMAKYVAVCKEKSAQLDRLVEELFTFTKTELLTPELLRRTVDLKLIFQASIDSLTPQARMKRVAIVTEFTADACNVTGDAQLLERAMNNLLDNAVRHSPPEGRVTVCCSREGAKVSFAVWDEGEGFSAEELERAFEPLYRGDPSRSRATGGAGLGLSISRSVIQRHGGELNAANRPGGGAELSGWMPASDD